MINRPNPAGVQIECGRCPNLRCPNRVCRGKLNKAETSMWFNLLCKLLETSL